MSWYRTYTRTIGRGYTLDDPDAVAFTLTTLSSFVYITYNIQVITDVSQYGTNLLYVSGDLMYFTGSIFYILANLRDDGWLWWIPVAGQYNVAVGRMQTERPVQVGLNPMLMGGSKISQCCNCRNTEVHSEKNQENNDNQEQYY